MSLYIKHFKNLQYKDIRKLKLFLIFIILLFLIGCTGDKFNSLVNKSKTSENIIDDGTKLSKDDYTKHLSNNTKETDQLVMDSGEEMPNFISEPIIPKMENDRLVSLSISNDIDVKDVLIELARIAEMDLEIDPKVKGNIILKVTDKPLSEAIDRITELANLRYTIKNNSLHVELDTPYSVSYPVDFLSIVRNNKNSYKIKVGLENSSGGRSSGSSSSGSAVGSGSSTEISYNQDENFWDNIQKDIKQMVDSTTYVTTNPTPYVSINKQAGIINVVTSSRVHNHIKDYLRRVKISTSAQALIEAKIVEVTLNDKYKSGIDWNVLNRSGQTGAHSSFSTPIGTFTTGEGSLTFGVLNGLGKLNSATANSKILNTNTNELAMAVNMMEMFGRARTLNSPRINAMNNQQAVLSFARNQVYFKLNIRQTQSTTTSSGSTSTPLTTNVTSELQTVPIGLVLTLQPSINLETNEITMSIRPTITRIVNTVNDPAIVFALLNNNLATTPDLTSAVPVVEVKELDSILKIKSGEIMVIGGMMEENYSTNENGIPVLKDMFLAGKLFKAQGQVKSTVQTVIFIKATIIPSSSNYSQQDKDFYNTFTNDPNPFRFKN